jgi:hypothetical protein
LFHSKYFFRTTPELEYLFFLSRKAGIFFQVINIRFYDKHSESDYFFQQHWESEQSLEHSSPFSRKKFLSLCIIVKTTEWNGLRERSINLKWGGGYGFFSKKIFWFPMLLKKIIWFWWRKKKNVIQSIYFFQHHWESEYFFRKKTIPPPPFKLNGRFLSFENTQEHGK